PRSSSRRGPRRQSRQPRSDRDSSASLPEEPDHRIDLRIGRAGDLTDDDPNRKKDTDPSVAKVFVKLVEPVRNLPRSEALPISLGGRVLVDSAGQQSVTYNQ